MDQRLPGVTEFHLDLGNTKAPLGDPSSEETCKTYRHYSLDFLKNRSSTERIGCPFCIDFLLAKFAEGLGQSNLRH